MQESLFIESINDALGTAIRAAGGFKIVSGKLWPGLKIESAYARLKGCLDEKDPQKLALHEFMQILRFAREAGDHTVMRYMGDDLSYEVTPTDPKDEAEQLRREIRDSLQGINRRMERLERVELKVKTVS